MHQMGVLRTSAKAKASSSKGGQASLNLEASVPGREGSHSRANVTISGASSDTISVVATTPPSKKASRPRAQDPTTLLLNAPKHMTQ